VGAYFERYAKEDVSLRVAQLVGQPALAAPRRGAAQPSSEPEGRAEATFVGA
jgi:hypothetical protein